MKPSLRVKLAVSNILPILLLMPFLSLYLFYSLEELFSQTLLQLAAGSTFTICAWGRSSKSNG